MFGTVSEEIQVAVPASEAWKVYGTLLLDDIVGKELPQLAHKIDVLEGDGGAGTILDVTFPPGNPPPLNRYKEKYVVVDDEKRVKVAQVVEGCHLDCGFTLFQFRFEVIEKDETTCITKVTIEYKVKELERVASILSASITAIVTLMEAAAKYLTQEKNGLC